MAKTTQKDIKALSKRIDSLRLERGLSIREFAMRCDISKSQVNELGNKGIDFRYSTLTKIAKGLEMTVTELVNF
jgi:transcriptional regulator with XRE-family HTH domain